MTGEDKPFRHYRYRCGMKVCDLEWSKWGEAPDIKQRCPFCGSGLYSHRVIADGDTA